MLNKFGLLLLLLSTAVNIYCSECRYYVYVGTVVLLTLFGFKQSRPTVVYSYEHEP